MDGDVNSVNSVGAYKFRICPDAARQAEIGEGLILARQFYNKLLGKSIASYQNERTMGS